MYKPPHINVAASCAWGAEMCGLPHLMGLWDTPLHHITDIFLPCFFLSFLGLDDGPKGPTLTCTLLSSLYQRLWTRDTASAASISSQKNHPLMAKTRVLKWYGNW